MDSTIKGPPLSSISNIVTSEHSQNVSSLLPRQSGDTAQSQDPSPYTMLALHVQHNLQYQHSWTSLELHTHSPVSAQSLLARPMLSGLPPTRLYVHPDQQAWELSAWQKAGKQAADTLSVEIEREWVLPAHLSEKWSLRRLAEIFDALPEPASCKENGSQHGIHAVERPVKRVLLAMLSDDSAVNYYIVHDGIVKPRQN